ncbi:MAG: DUF2088 domain-containing protein [Phycisphaerae bacterium]|nr:DUF2088 domain-containing protein [Phycisphaerae bacterium]
MDYFAEGSPEAVIDEGRAATLLHGILARLGRPRRVLIVPPDITRLHSGAGMLTAILYHSLADTAEMEILPALGTHAAMTAEQQALMFPGLPADAFRTHDWRNDLVRLGEVPASFIRQVSEGRVDYPVFCEVNRQLVEGRWDAIISIGQVVPHEVVGIANHNKNLLIGLGGPDTIHKTHFLGAVYGMERMMGRTASPVRDVLNYMTRHFLRDLPITYVLTVRAPGPAGGLITRGLYAGDDESCFLAAADLCRRVNIERLAAPLQRVVVWLDPLEYRSTWLGNKAIYRTRMALADGGELIILAPGVREFGEDATIDRLIRQFGYHGTPHTLRMVAEHPELTANLSAAAHLIHGSSEGRFRITYCPGALTRDQIEGVGFAFGDVNVLSRRYNPRELRDGFNTLPDGEELFFISNPALGLWGLRTQFEGSA